MALTSLVMTAVGAFSNTMVIGKDWCDEPGIVETNQEYAAVYVVVAVSFTFINLVMNDQRQDKTRQDKTRQDKTRHKHGQHSTLARRRRR